MKKGLEHLANTIAAGFRSLKTEMRGHRVALGQVQSALVSYNQSVDRREAANVQRIADLEADVEELKRKVAPQ